MSLNDFRSCQVPFAPFAQQARLDNQQMQQNAIKMQHKSPLHKVHLTFPPFSFAGAQRDVDGSDGSDVCRGRSVHTFHVANASDARAAGAWHAGAASGAYPKRRREIACFGSLQTFQKLAKLHFWISNFLHFLHFIHLSI